MSFVGITRLVEKLRIFISSMDQICIGRLIAFSKKQELTAHHLRNDIPNNDTEYNSQGTRTSEMRS